jgi:nucleotide-binding universal stress UspA family protein
MSHQSEAEVSSVSILICYDGSDSARRALAVAASSLDGAPAVLLNTWNPPQRVLADSFGVDEHDAGLNVLQLERLSEQRAAEILAQGEAQAAQLQYPVMSRQEVNRSSVWQTILEIADEVDATLIVAGTHGSTAVQSGLLGSVSNALVHHAHRPVLLVPTPNGHGS